MSEFIEKSKHAAMTAVVEAHFGSGAARGPADGNSGKGFELGGTDAWNGQTSDTGLIQRGNVNRAPSGNDIGASQFNATTPKMNEGAGFGYTPNADIGHTVKDDPFEGWADGMPGDKRQLWKK